MPAQVRTTSPLPAAASPSVPRVSSVPTGARRGGRPNHHGHAVTHLRQAPPGGGAPDGLSVRLSYGDAVVTGLGCTAYPGNSWQPDAAYPSEEVYAFKAGRARATAKLLFGDEGL